MAAKPRRAVLRKAADAGVHPAEPRVASAPARAARPARPRTGSGETPGTGARAARSGGGRAGSD
jgi:hypothetical protein